MRRGCSPAVNVGKTHGAWREDCFHPTLCMSPLHPEKATKVLESGLAGREALSTRRTLPENELRLLQEAGQRRRYATTLGAQGTLRCEETSKLLPRSSSKIPGDLGAPGGESQEDGALSQPSAESMASSSPFFPSASDMSIMVPATPSVLFWLELPLPEPLLSMFFAEKRLLTRLGVDI
ncbi:uncharacterized protein RBU33_028257 [Hipposideros larvatus]